MKKLWILLFSLLAASLVYGANVTVEVMGEAQILNNDITSAKIQAESRAKWAAMEQAAQVKVSAASVVHNAELLDELVKAEVSGSIVSFTILDEGKDGDIYWMQAKAVVEPEKASNTLNSVSMNTKIAVYMPLIGPDNKVEESHPFSEQLINELINKGFEVVDIAMETDSATAQALSNAVQKNDTAAVRRLVTQFMAGSALVGSVKVIDKGNNIGYTQVNFSLVDGEVTYRLIGDKDGIKSTLKSGSATGRGQGATPEAAAYNVSRALSQRTSSQVASEVATTVMGANKKSVRVVLVGNNDLRKFQQFRDTLKNISWVLNVRESGIDTVLLDYPEKTLYLATIISRNGGYKIRKFTDTEILVDPL